MRDNVLWRKIARIIILIAKELDIDEEQALTIFYQSRAYRMLKDPRRTFDERRNILIFNAYKKTILRIDTILFPNKNNELLHGKIEVGKN